MRNGQEVSSGVKSPGYKLGLFLGTECLSDFWDTQSDAKLVNLAAPLLRQVVGHEALTPISPRMGVGIVCPIMIYTLLMNNLKLVVINHIVDIKYMY